MKQGTIEGRITGNVQDGKKWRLKTKAHTQKAFMPFNPFQNKPLFLHLSSTSFFKTLWEEEKLLVISNFIFSYSIFNPFGELSVIFINLKLSSTNTVSLEESKIYRFRKRLNGEKNSVIIVIWETMQEKYPITCNTQLFLLLQ